MGITHGAALVSGPNLNINSIKGNKYKMAKVKVKMTRNAVSKGKPEPKGKVLEFNKEDAEWLNLIHANAAELVKDEPDEKPKSKK